MTRTTKYNDHHQDALPKYYAKHGILGQDPNKLKKDGHGRGNMGREMDDVEELQRSGEFNFYHARRRSNSTSAGHADMLPPNKFEYDEQYDEVFEEY